MSAPFYVMHYLKEFTIFPQGEGRKASLFKMLLCLFQLII